MKTDTAAKSQHTPTPWKLDEAGIIWGPREFWAGKNRGFQEIANSINEADATFIVRAVNVHEQLVEALNELHEDSKCDCLNGEVGYCIAGKAIAKACGKHWRAIDKACELMGAARHKALAKERRLQTATCAAKPTPRGLRREP